MIFVFEENEENDRVDGIFYELDQNYDFQCGGVWDKIDFYLEVWDVMENVQI